MQLTDEVIAGFAALLLIPLCSTRLRSRVVEVAAIVASSLLQIGSILSQ